MCGIFVCGSQTKDRVSDRKCGEKFHDNTEHILQLIRNRGPDGFSELNMYPQLNWKLQFVGSILWMQGNKPTQQPLTDESSSILLWNGDIFDGSLISVDGKSDTSTLLLHFTRNSYSETEFLKLVSAIKGPYAFVYWCAHTHKLWFGRDRMGRHSLLWNFESNDEFMLSSVGVRGLTFMEVPTTGLFSLEFVEGSYKLVLYPWSDTMHDDILSLETQLPLTISEVTPLSPIVVQCPVPYEPPEDYLQLINFCCDTAEVQETLKKLVSHTIVSDKVDELLCCLKEAVRRRTSTHPGLCSNCVKRFIINHSENQIDCAHPKIGILFSGGLDSTIIAALAHEYIPVEEPIDLFNVAFKCRKSGENQKHKSSHEFLTPDRSTGAQTYEELRRLFPSRQWNFVEINIPNEELEKYRSTKIGDLIHPLNTVLDDSLGCALWFASRRQGMILGNEYSSPTRVVLLGMGADEQFGGYMRHRNILRHKGWRDLSAEIHLELSRISVRNLGRDDRIVADHGCQARFPYLDEDVINYVSTLPIWTRCFPVSHLPPGLGDKILLRLVAWKLGLHKACSIPKRAFQFGSRIANSKEKAADVSSRLIS